MSEIIDNLSPPPDPITEVELEVAFRYFCDYAPEHSEWTRLRCAINAFLSVRRRTEAERGRLNAKALVDNQGRG